MEDDTVRFNINLPRALNDTLQAHIPWGSKNNIILSVLAELAITLEEHKKLALVDLMNGDFKIVCGGLVSKERK